MSVEWAGWSEAADYGVCFSAWPASSPTDRAYRGWNLAVVRQFLFEYQFLFFTALALRREKR